jgi:hypothetical protein
LDGVVAETASAVEGMAGFVAHQHANPQLLGAAFACERFSPRDELAADAAAAMGSAHDQIRDIRIRPDQVVGRREHLRQYADESNHRSVFIGEKNAPAALFAAGEDLGQVGIGHLLGNR